MSDNLPDVAELGTVMETATGQALLDGLLLAAHVAEACAKGYAALGTGAPSADVACREIAGALRQAAFELGTDQFGEGGHA